jgi:hypothetical protein
VIWCWTRLWRSSGFLKTKPTANTASPSSPAFPKSKPWFPCCGSMKSATAFWWLIAESGLPRTRSRGFLTRLKNLPIEAAPQAPIEVLDLPALAQTHSLTNYDAAYLSLALRLHLPLATNDAALLGSFSCPFSNFYFLIGQNELSPDDVDARADLHLLPGLVRRIYRRLQGKPKRQTSPVTQ